MHPRAVHWLIFGALLAMLFGMRWISVNGQYSHPDEVIPHAVVQQMRESRSLNTNWVLADLPSAFRYPQFNFSGHVMAMYAMELVRCAQLDETTCKSTRVQAMRRASVLAMAFVWLATYLLARRFGGPWLAMLATAGTAVSAQLFQDSIYARPEAFCTALFLALLLVSVRASSERLAHWALAGGLVGLLTATKVSFLPMALLMPALALWGRHAEAPTARITAAPLVAALLTYALALLAGVTAGAPYVWVEPDAAWHGIARLSAQYATGHWPHGSPEFSVPERLLHGAHYLIATAGVATLVLAVAGASALGRERIAPLVGLAVPLLFYVGYFSTSAAFFERNFSHVMPVLFVLAALGARWIVQRCAGGRQAALLVAAVIVAGAMALPGAVQTIRVYDTAVRGRFADKFLTERDRLAAACRCVRSELISADDSWADAPIVAPDRHRQADSVLLSVAHFGDPRSARMLREIAASPGAKEVGRLASPFDGVPTSSLHVYHAPNVRFFVVARRYP